MKNNKLSISWDKLEPSEQANERMLEKILKKNRSFNEKKAADLSKQTQSRKNRFRWGLAAASLALILFFGSAAFAIVSEAEEYNNAVAFFEENGLSTEGLSRTEVKNVYRDITEKKFTYSKTAEIISQSVTGLEIQQKEPTPEELSEVWNKNFFTNRVSANGIDCRSETKYVYDENRGFEVFEKAVFEYFRDGELLWTAEFTDFYIEDYLITNDGIAVWGNNAILSSLDTVTAWVAFIDGEGNVLWQRCLEHGFKNEYVASVLNNGDGTWAVISRGDLKYLCLSCRDENGNELSFHKTEVGNLGIWNVARLGEGYIVQLGNMTSRDVALLYKMDRKGQITDGFSFEADDCDYYIADLAEFGGKVYLSAYSVPMQTDEGGRHEIANVLDYITEDKWDISSEELTPILRDNYTAVLLICDADSGIPKTFYSVKGSLGGKISVNGAGELEWNVESITSAFFSPATSSFTIGGSCSVFCYTFNAEGELIGEEDTGYSVPYRR
ncbi:MAG: hypothetical protein IJL30_09225 [Clostridia bacterium]|nr:hypothetical protein [Clostridia bacterium]